MRINSCQLRDFLSNPSEEKLSKFENKESALFLLDNQASRSAKLYFYWIRGDKIKVLDLYEAIFKDNREDLFFSVYEKKRLNRKSINKVAKLAAKYGREKELDFLINKGANDWVSLYFALQRGGYNRLKDKIARMSHKDWNMLSIPIGNKPFITTKYELE